MTYRLGLVLLVSMTVACGDASDPMGDGGTEQSTTPGDTTTTGNDDTTVTTTTGNDSFATTFGGDATGSVDDDTGFGMGDDMPLLTSIPDIKQGLVENDLYVRIPMVRPTSARASFDGVVWFYVEDTETTEYMGLRVTLPDEELPDVGRRLDLIGYVHRDEQGWSLDLDSVNPGGEHEGAVPQMVSFESLASDVYDDALIGLTAGGSLEVAEQTEDAGVWTVRDDTGASALMDLRPFLVEGLPLVPGTRLGELVGIAEIVGDVVTILPRSVDDIVLAG